MAFRDRQLEWSNVKRTILVSNLLAPRTIRAMGNTVVLEENKMLSEYPLDAPKL